MKKYFYLLIMLSTITMQLVCMELSLTKEMVANTFQKLTEAISKSKRPRNDSIINIKNALPIFEKHLQNDLSIDQLKELQRRINLARMVLKISEREIPKDDQRAGSQSRARKDRPFDKKSQHPYWQRGLAYLGISALWTATGIYSYYKIPHDSCYRPFIIAFNAIGGLGYAFLSAKNFRTKKNKSD